MKITNLLEQSTTYTSNVYLVQGSWNTLSTVNTLVDVGRDPSLLTQLEQASTGVGKPKVEQVVMTHSHYDHAELLPKIKEIYNPVVYAFSPYLKNVDHVLKDSDILKMGDREFEVIYTPGHSNDSVCFYCEQDSVLFVGDTPIIMRTAEGSYEDEFIKAFERLCEKNAKTIYFGHGDPLTEGANAIMRTSLQMVKKAVKSNNAPAVTSQKPASSRTLTLKNDGEFNKHSKYT